MSFLKFFWRDLHADQSYNWFTILCASLGIVGLLLVESFRVGVEDKVATNAKNFIAADLSISSRRALDQTTQTKIESYLAKNNFNYARWTETYSMVSSSQSNTPLAKLADLNFVSSNFPFYGGVILENEGFMGPGSWQRLHNSPIAWISRDLSWELGVKSGDSIKIGELNFVIDGIITDDKFSSFRGFNLAPKIFISYNYLNQTELIKFGSTATFAYAIKIPSDHLLKNIQKEFRSIVPDRTIKIIGPEESSQQVSRALRILGDYLSLITLMTYLLSLIGLYYFTQHFLSKKIKTFSIYKALGVKTIFLFKINFAHLVVLTIFSVLASVTLVLLFLPLLQNFFSNLIGEILFFKLNSTSIFRIMTLSLFGSLLALGPLFWGALQTPVAVVFQDLPAELKRIKFYYFIPLLLYIAILTFFLANSFKVATYFLIALSTIIIVGALCFKLFTIILEIISSKFKFITRHAFKSLSRYFTSSFTIFICLLIGMTLTTFIFQLESSLRQEFGQTYGNKKPDIFMFDLQENQLPEFEQLIKTENWNQTMLAPMIRGRLLRINNKIFQQKEANTDTNYTTREDEQSEQMRNRGVNLSYRKTLSWSEHTVKGTFSGETCFPQIKICELSLVESYAKTMGIELGDKLIFDISGTEVSGIVTSMRKVKWTSFEPNFFILFQPGVLEDAPKTYLLSFKVKNFNDKRYMFSKVAQLFPNVSVLEVSEILKKITTIFDLMVMAIKFIAYLSLFVAFVVLIAVSFNHLELRKKEMTLYYMLGLKVDKIKLIYSREFSFLIILCLILSLIFGSSMTLAMMKFIFDSEAVLNLLHIIPLMISLGVILFIIVSIRIQQLVKRKSLF